MKKIASVIAVVFVLIVVTSGVYAAGKDVIEFKGGAFGKVTFNHKAHQDMGISCNTCHHKDEAGKEQACSTCHTKDSKVKAKDAYHNSCKKCHEEGKKGPTKCGDCHKKK